MKARCMRCKTDRDMANAKEVIIEGKAKMKAMKGTCAKCGCKMCKILGKA